MEALTPEEFEAIRGAMIFLFWLGAIAGGVVGTLAGSISTAIKWDKDDEKRRTK